MKIALIGATLYHQGAEYVLATIARGLFKRGHDVTVILSKHHEDIKKVNPMAEPFALSQGIKEVILPVRRARHSLVCLRRIVKNNDFDVIISHDQNYSYAIACATIGLRRCPKLIHVEHSGLIGVNRLGECVQPPASLKSFLKNKLMRRMSMQIAVSKGTADAIARSTSYPRDRICHIYNPVIDEEFVRKKSQNLDLPIIGNANQVPIVMAAGAFNSLKNYSMLIEAFAEVLKSKEAHLIIFGDGPLRDSYKTLAESLGIADKVQLPGRTNNLPAMLKHASCFVVSSIIESFSIVLVEALACGVPVVATDCPYGPREILQCGKFGLLVESKSKSALAEGMLQVINGKGIAPSSEMVLSYHIESVVDNYETLMKKVIDKQ